MEKLILTYVGRDDWDRAVFTNEDGRYFKDVDLKMGKGTICTASDFDGEPDTPIHYIARYKDLEIEIVGTESLPTEAERFNYMMLGRLQQDCNYYLGNGNRYEKHLWAGNVKDQIVEMKRIYKLFNEDKKPEWLTWEQIKGYEKLMSEV